MTHGIPSSAGSASGDQEREGNEIERELMEQGGVTTGRLGSQGAGTVTAREPGRGGNRPPWERR